MTATDLVYGRRGGRWVPDGAGLVFGRLTFACGHERHTVLAGAFRPGHRALCEECSDMVELTGVLRSSSPTREEGDRWGQ